MLVLSASSFLALRLCLISRGMAGSLAYAFSKIGRPRFIIVAPILGWIGVALSGSNTSTNAMFGAFQFAVGKMLSFPPLLLPTLNSVGSGGRQASGAANGKRRRFEEPICPK